MNEEFISKLAGMEEGTNFHTWVKWTCNTESAAVLLEEDIPAGTYSLRDGRMIGAAFTSAADAGENAHAVLKWLVESGVDVELAKSMVVDMAKKADHKTLMNAMSSFLGTSWR
jgi:hypothetical protein